MKRFGLKQAFHGEGDRGAEPPGAESDSQDEVLLDVVGGTVSFAVRSDVPDDRILKDNLADRYISCKLQLENGAELHLWVVEGAYGVDWRLTPAQVRTVPSLAT